MTDRPAARGSGKWRTTDRARRVSAPAPVANPFDATAPTPSARAGWGALRQDAPVMSGDARAACPGGEDASADGREGHAVVGVDAPVPGPA